MTRTARKPPRRAQAARREEAMTTILDAAEALFAEHGRDGVTVRALAEAADVDAPLVHYYFDDLEGVYRAVFLRKSTEINRIRNQAMDDYLAVHGKQPSIQGAFDTFLQPAFNTIAADPKYWLNFATMVSYANSSRFHGRQYMREFDTTVQRFLDLLMRLAPDVPPAEIYWFYHLMSGSLAMCLAQTGRIDILSRGLCKSADLMAVLEPMTLVYRAGFEALRARHAKAARAGGASQRRRRARKSPAARTKRPEQGGDD
jgi:AcrR family transcriptional regulator